MINNDRLKMIEERTRSQSFHDQKDFDAYLKTCEGTIPLDDQTQRDILDLIKEVRYYRRTMQVISKIALRDLIEDSSI